MTDRALTLDRMPRLAELFRALSNGKHINRASDPTLWVELEQEQDAYQALFSALGYELRVDRRGFAWFHMDDANANLSNQSRQLALLFMVIFDAQADAGRPLGRFEDWVIDRDLLQTAFEQHQELLLAEELTVDGLQSLLDTAERFGLARHAHGRWMLLPAVCRYLDHFEALVAEQSDQATAENADALDSGDVIE